MRHWIAYEHDEDAGWPSEAYLVVTADTQEDAREIMAAAIASKAATADRTSRSRYWAIFIEAPRELAENVARAAQYETGFHGFDKPRTPRSP